MGRWHVIGDLPSYLVPLLKTDIPELPYHSRFDDKLFLGVSRLRNQLQKYSHSDP